MSGMADLIRERRAREVPAPTEEGVATEEAWKALWEDEEEWEEEWEEEDEWEEEEGDDEWGEEEWKESLAKKILNAKALLPRLVDFVVDTTTIALVPTTLLLLAIASQKTSFEIFEAALLVGGATVVTLTIANFKARLLQRLRLR